VTGLWRSIIRRKSFMCSPRCPSTLAHSISTRNRHLSQHIKLLRRIIDLHNPVTKEIRSDQSIDRTTARTGQLTQIKSKVFAGEFNLARLGG